MENVTSPTYYYPFVIAFVIIFAIVQLGIYFVKRSRDNKDHQNVNLTPEEMKCLNNPEFITKGNDLKKKFMVVYLLCKAAMWSKAPYTFMLLSTLHKFTISEIGVLYIIDAVMSLIAGPFLGVFSDTFGRKFTSSLYSCSNMLVIFMRLSGSRPLAYTAQFFTGVFGGGILSTAYEAWLNYEMTKLYGDKKNYIQLYRKDIFSKIQLYDSFLSISVTVCGAILFNSLGIYYSLMLSVILSATSLTFLLIWWDENKPNASHGDNIFKSLGEAANLLKKPSIISLGITDSLYQSSIQIFVFIWTPALQISAQGQIINPGMCYILMLTSFLIQNKCLELSNKLWHVNYFILSSIFLTIFTIEFFGVYIIDSFSFRLVLLAFINGSGGIYLPILSCIRSEILPENYRTTLMTLFRVPLNIFLILLLLSSKYFDPFDICLIVSGLLIIALISSIYLINNKDAHHEHNEILEDVDQNYDINQK